MKSLTANKLNASASGVADVVPEGTAQTLNADGTSGADLDARKLTMKAGNANSLVADVLSMPRAN